MDHLLEDFDYLIDQMNLSETNFRLHDIHVRINDEKLVKKSIKNYVFKRGVLTDFVAMVGLIPLISTYLLGKIDLNVELFSPVVVGFILWLATLYIGYRSEPEYVLKK